MLSILVKHKIHYLIKNMNSKSLMEYNKIASYNSYKKFAIVIM